ncbi:MAG: MATE family efflux transporter [Acholeplasmatales bacterium]|nr:MAG: MATE family efflux transporter [Acholeplasmatales bacterium]
MFKLFIGDRLFYKALLTLTVPLVLQQLITTSVQLIDNIMVGRLGESAISSVAVINQLQFVIILVFFGLMAGSGIFTSQYFGAKDFDKLAQTFRFKVIAGLFVAGVAVLILTVFGRHLVVVFTDTDETVASALSYLAIVKWGIFPLVLSIAISSTFRETGITRPLLYISTVAVLINTALNYVLIFGHFGAPQMGIEGAAIATVIARGIEFFLMFLFMMRKGQYFTSGIRRLFVIERSVLVGIIAMAIPLTLNEFMWSLGQTVFLHAYSTRGDSALAAMNMTNAISQLVFVTFAGIGTGVAVLVGNTLGKNELALAKQNAYKLAAFSVVVAILAGIGLFGLSFFILDLYAVSAATKSVAAFNIRVNAFFIPVFSLNVSLFFILRSGGDTRSTLLMDAVFMWVFVVPVALLLAYTTALPVTLMFLIVQSSDVPKAFIAISRFKKGHWIKNLAATPSDMLADHPPLPST